MAYQYPYQAPPSTPNRPPMGQPVPQPAYNRPPMGQPAPPAPYYPPQGGGGGGGEFVQPPPPKRAGTFKASNGAEEFNNKWATSLMSAPCKNPGFCCLACFCPCCCAYRQRKRLLLGNMSNYVCCGGLFGACSERCTNCFSGECGLCLEVICCISCAVHGNRWMIQSTYQLENECCDVFIMYLACVCSWIGCLVSCFIDQNLGQVIDNIADMIFHIVMGCMMAQHDYELNYRNYPYNTPGVRPGVQHMK